VVRLLIQRSSDVHARDDEGLTPFQLASANGYDDVMQLLLEHGAEDHRAQ
jgi:ankyrin repeat protein